VVIRHKPDTPRLIAATEGFTGADLKRLVEDGKAIYVYDKARGAEIKPTSDYFMRAVECREGKQAALRSRPGPGAFSAQIPHGRFHAIVRHLTRVRGRERGRVIRVGYDWRLVRLGRELPSS